MQCIATQARLVPTPKEAIKKVPCAGVEWQLQWHTTRAASTGPIEGPMVGQRSTKG